jgi:hypothetical protein
MLGAQIVLMETPSDAPAFTLPASLPVSAGLAPQRLDDIFMRAGADQAIWLGKSRYASPPTDRMLLLPKANRGRSAFLS